MNFALCCLSVRVPYANVWVCTNESECAYFSLYTTTHIHMHRYDYSLIDYIYWFLVWIVAAAVTATAFFFVRKIIVKGRFIRFFFFKIYMYVFVCANKIKVSVWRNGDSDVKTNCMSEWVCVNSTQIHLDLLDTILYELCILFFPFSIDRNELNE